MEDLEKNHPKTFAYVKANKIAFESRESGKAKKADEIYQYLRENNISKFDQDKLVSMEICSKWPNITTDRGSTYHTTKVYSLVKLEDTSTSLEFFADVLNSDIFWWFMKHTGDTLQGDARTMKTNYLNPFPLPKAVSKEDEKRISKLVLDIVAEKAGSACSERVAVLEEKINQCVYALYGFEEEDIQIVERALNGCPAATAVTV